MTKDADFNLEKPLLRTRLIGRLEEVQAKFGYLPESELKRLAQELELTLADIVSVASFYAAFRFKPAGKYEIRVCVGSACHVKGADGVYEALYRLLELSGDSDTDKSGIFTLSRVACLGCCMIAPAVMIGNKVYGWVDSKDVASLLENFLKSAESGGEEAQGDEKKYRDEVRICLCSSCAAAGAGEVYRRLKKEIARGKYKVDLKQVGCTGMSYRTPLLQIQTSDGLLFDYGGVSEYQVPEILAAHFSPQGALRKVRAGFGKIVDKIYAKAPLLSESSKESKDYLGLQLRIATANAGEISPLDFDAYRGVGGFKAYEKALSMEGGEIISEVLNSGLRGRGGGGFPTGKKWQFLAEAEGEKYIICNADEGDPGAFMDRMLLESFPFRVIEAMMIASLATGALKGKFYIRQEYSKAVSVLKEALKICEQRGILPAKNGFKIDIFTGAGAFVCGEETALIASLEGFRGEPRLRPPYPAQKGYLSRPTLINNVETLANIPYIILNGASSFSKYGTADSKGAKTFALAGKIRRGGLIEVPLGTTIREILEGIGGGAAEGRKLKAVQIGGPSGGCIPESMFDLKVDYKELQNVGAIMGSGGLVALDDRDCMVDIAAYFLKFTTAESCGKCSACRVGCAKMLAIIEKIRSGKGEMSDLDELESLGNYIKSASLCGLGKTAPNPALSALRHFRNEFIEHINGKCAAGKCRALTTYVITDECIGCTKCFQVCASGAIKFEPLKKHSIDSHKCTRCGACRDACPANAIEVLK